MYALIHNNKIFRYFKSVNVAEKFILKYIETAIDVPNDYERIEELSNNPHLYSKEIVWVIKDLNIDQIIDTFRICKINPCYI